MGVIFREVWYPDLHRYEPEFNEDGTEKHINCDGARFHVIHWDSQGAHCSEPNCEMNKAGSNVELSRADK